ncbi:MAG: hypothetical protein RBS19_05785 [Bacteroidales bacterium]|nr:hypothetical protein [Bacteroidales bacterium]
MKNILFLIVFAFAGLSLFSQNPDRNTAEQYLKRGEYMMDKGNYVDAISNFSLAIESDITYAEAYRKRALAIKMSDTEQEGISYCDDMKKAVSLGSESAKKELKQSTCD